MNRFRIWPFPVRAGSRDAYAERPANPPFCRQELVAAYYDGWDDARSAMGGGR